MKARLAGTIAAVLGLQACGQHNTAPNTAPDIAKVTTPPTARLVAFCASEAGDYHDGFCSGYLLGYAYGLDGKPASGVCVPENVTVRQIRDAAIRYLRNNPGTQQQDASIAVVAALRAGFPCPK